MICLSDSGMKWRNLANTRIVVICDAIRQRNGWTEFLFSWTATRMTSERIISAHLHMRRWILGKPSDQVGGRVNGFRTFFLNRNSASLRSWEERHWLTVKAVRIFWEPLEWFSCQLKRSSKNMSRISLFLSKFSNRRFQQRKTWPTGMHILTFWEPLEWFLCQLEHSSEKNFGIPGFRKRRSDRLKHILILWKPLRRFLSPNQW